MHCPENYYKIIDKLPILLELLKEKDAIGLLPINNILTSTISIGNVDMLKQLLEIRPDLSQVKLSNPFKPKFAGSLKLPATFKVVLKFPANDFTLIISFK